MNNFFLLITNRIFISFFLAVIINQLAKLIIVFFKTKKLDFDVLFSHGGMPSGHAASICAASSAIYFSEGISNIFILSLIVAIFIMYDARGVRHQSQKQAILLNKLSKGANLKENLGHTNKEVFMGMILGIIISYIVFLI
jgi:hypothetical protein